MHASPAPLPQDSPKQVSKSHFKTHALALFRLVEATGQPLLVTNHGRPCVEVRPYRPAPPTDLDPLETLHGSVLRFDDPFEPVVDSNDWNVLA